MTARATPAPTDRRALRGVRRRILAWYAAAARDVPWRRTTDPWAVLVSEVMLQQTQASRVADRFAGFLARFPTPAAMAAAPTADVLAAWSGLGYNRRALALHRAGQQLATTRWPSTVAGLQALPGVGPYTARAVAALAFGQPVGAVDTNVRRWLVRRFGLPPPATPARLQALADGLAAADPDTTATGAADWMHASMEFGAVICRARSPRCEICPVRAGCPSRGSASHVPVPRQMAFAGSERLLRGRLLRELSSGARHAMPLARARELGEGHDLERVLQRLERDGLVHRRGAWLRLGPGPASGAPSTIGS
jgi:A/G-specific adenine glycosylase